MACVETHTVTTNAPETLSIYNGMVKVLTMELAITTINESQNKTDMDLTHFETTPLYWHVKLQNSEDKHSQ